MVKQATARITALGLFIIMLCTLIGSIVTPAYADANIAGSGLTGNIGGTQLVMYNFIK